MDEDLKFSVPAAGLYVLVPCVGNCDPKALNVVGVKMPGAYRVVPCLPIDADETRMAV